MTEGGQSLKSQWHRTFRVSTPVAYEVRSNILKVWKTEWNKTQLCFMFHVFHALSKEANLLDTQMHSQAFNARV